MRRQVVIQAVKGVRGRDRIDWDSRQAFLGLQCLGMASSVVGVDQKEQNRERIKRRQDRKTGWADLSTL